MDNEMFLRALIAFIALPGMAAIVAPPIIAHFDPWKGGAWPPAIIIMSMGAFVLLSCVRDFYVMGKGTLAPWDPPKRLVVIGLYRYVRNPMYVGVVMLVFGWSLFFQSPLLLSYTALLAITFHIRVVRYEEHKLNALFGEEWKAYKKSVSRWMPGINPLSRGMGKK